MNEDIARIRRMHDAASKAERNSYTDPRSGLFVMTAHYLKSRGYCCAAGCRHCPWSTEVQAAAGRPSDAPCWEQDRY